MRNSEKPPTPSYKELAEILKFDEKTISRAVKHLQLAGAVVRIPRYAENGAQLSNKYFIKAFDDNMAVDVDYQKLVKSIEKLKG